MLTSTQPRTVILRPRRSWSTLERFESCGVRVDVLTLEEAVCRIIALAKVAGPASSVHLCNAYTLSLAVRSYVFRDLINSSTLNLPDGMPLVWLARSKGFSKLYDRVYGPDLMTATMQAGRDRGLRHFLYGSTPSVIGDLTSELKRMIPGVSIVGHMSPPFGVTSQKDYEEFESAFARLQPDVTWVGLGTPKQDEFVEAARRHSHGTLVAVGAAFDFHAGHKRSAPVWMKRRGLEWLFRLVTEPRRLWKRYLIGNCVFLYGLLRDQMRRGSSR